MTKKTYTVLKGKKFYTKVAGEHGEKTVRHEGGDEVELTDEQAFGVRDRLVPEQAPVKKEPKKVLKE